MDGFEVFNGKATYPGYTTAQLNTAINSGLDATGRMAVEVEHRAKVAAGDMSVATGAERLKLAKKAIECETCDHSCVASCRYD